MGSFKRHKGRIRIFGIQANLDFSLATRYEWTALQKDVNKGLESRNQALLVRPEYVLVPYSELERELDYFTSGRSCYAIIASCPSRIDENRNVMAEVKILASK